mmetsp:Transcript_9702/g.22447  ORF Transcript_9702/g.22447 Transcript_9702/m.22447 type:complete len:84 (-) Transcript_9702:8-259(-)
MCAASSLQVGIMAASMAVLLSADKTDYKRSYFNSACYLLGSTSALDAQAHHKDKLSPSKASADQTDPLLQSSDAAPAVSQQAT